MVQTLAVTDHITSLAEAEKLLGIALSHDPEFFTEWMLDRSSLTETQQQMASIRCLLSSIGGNMPFLTIFP